MKNVPNKSPSFNSFPLQKLPVPGSPPPLVLQPQKPQPQQQPIAQKASHKSTHIQSPTTNIKRVCLACRASHVPGQCPYKLAGVELCPLCKIAHYGKGPICPHLSSETRVVAMMDCLRQSNEDPTLVSEAMRYLRGRLGELRRRKKLARLEERKKEMEAGRSVGLPDASTSEQVQRSEFPAAKSTPITSIMVID